MSSLFVSAEAFSQKCPLFQLENIPAKDFVKFYSSIKTEILASPFSYILTINDQVKASFVCLPASCAHEHEVPESMRDYNEFFTTKFQENMKFFNLEKCIYGLFLGSTHPGAGKILYSKLFDDMGKYGYTQVYWEMSNPINTKTLNRFGRELEGLKIDLINQAYFKEKVRVDFFLTNCNNE